MLPDFMFFDDLMFSSRVVLCFSTTVILFLFANGVRKEDSDDCFKVSFGRCRRVLSFLIES